MSGRIPQSFIDQLLNRIDIVDLIDGYVPLKKAGANYKACCPFHDEKTPSFTVSQQKQFYHCFGCGANGTAISFLMEHEHMEFRDAVQHLANSAGLEIPTEAINSSQKSAKQGVDLYALMDKANHFYQQQLRQHPQKQQPIDYLKNRGLSGQIAKKFGMGYAPDGWDNLLKELGNTEENKKALIDTGMLSKNEKERIYDRFRQRIMFPIHDHRGRVVGFGGRVLDSGEPKYLNSPETPIFHKGSELYGLFAAKSAIKQEEAVLVVEGYMDVVALAQNDINHCVATLGTATTRMHLERLFRFTSNIVFCFDGDRAGKQAAWRALETCLPLLQDGKQISFLFLPDGEDPDSMVRKEGTERFRERIQQAMPLPDFMLNNLQQQADTNRLDGRAKLADMAKPLLNKLPKGVLKDLLVEKVARLAKTDARSLANHLVSQQTNSTNKPRKAHNKQQNGAPLSPIRNAISLLLQHPKLAVMIGDLSEFKQSDLRGYDVFVELAETILQHHGVNTASLLERYREQSHFQALEKLATHHHLMDESELETTFQAVLQQLKNALIEQQLEQLIEKSKHESLNDIEKEKLKSLISQNSAI